MRRFKLGRASIHVVLATGVLISFFPFYWMVVMATNTTADIYRYPPKLTPGSHLIENIHRLLDSIDFFGSMLNTVMVAITTTVLVLFIDSLAAFTFAKYRFPGRNFLFGALLALYMLPTQLAILPQFIIASDLGLAGTLRALIIPPIANAFGIFWMRQYITSAVPDELIDAAKVDGAGFFRQYWQIAIPAIRPGLAFLGIYVFVAAWNDYIWPLIVLVDPDRITLQLALAQLNTAHGTDFSMVMAGTLLAIIPLVVIFGFFARNFIADATKGAVRE
ncbi:carbohydrate ABC transporter permease [Actinoplanes subtropicus]|uniref:carbohydrate ABC transporter permease n=1 Tax=Actinoplanes subtropicus TaxID=543632 RepID=UPI00054D3ADA|nr:carbohydrate ABC transporter permease [Actinoplanes subtropicus]